MARSAYFIRRRGDECSVIKINPDGSEEIVENGLTLVEAETLYHVCIGNPMQEVPTRQAEDDRARPVSRRPRQLTFKF